MESNLAADRFRFQSRPDRFPGTFASGLRSATTRGLIDLEETMQSTKFGLLAAVAAAALVAGTALAQEKSMGGQGPSAPSNSELQSGAKSEKTEKKATQSPATQGSGSTAQSPQAPGGTQVQSGSEAPRGQAQDKEMTKSSGKDTQSPRGQAQDMKSKDVQQRPSQTQGTQQRPGQAQDSKTTDNKASVQLNQEQRTKISSTIKQSNVNLRKVSRSEVNFTINVGAVVPRTVNLVALPAPIIAVVPQYRGYLYIVVDDQLLIIHPQTYEIVAVIAV
jgi:hypothetical protein